LPQDVLVGLIVLVAAAIASARVFAQGR